MALARALGIDDPSHLTELQLSVKPCQLPRVTASFLVRSADGLAVLMRDYEIHALSGDVSRQAEQPQKARDAA
jgi:hypothetical protein